MAAPVQATKNEIKPINARDWQSEAGLYQTRHLAVIDPAIYPACLDECRYFSLVEAKISAFDRCEFRASDNTFVADCIVAQVIQKSFIRLVEVSRTMLSNEPTPLPKATGDWQTFWLGGNRAWAVIDPTGKIARDGFLSKVNADSETQIRRQGAPLNTLSGR